MCFRWQQDINFEWGLSTNLYCRVTSGSAFLDSSTVKAGLFILQPPKHSVVHWRRTTLTTQWLVTDLHYPKQSEYKPRLPSKLQQHLEDHIKLKLQTIHLNHDILVRKQWILYIVKFCCIYENGETCHFSVHASPVANCVRSENRDLRHWYWKYLDQKDTVIYWESDI